MTTKSAIIYLDDKDMRFVERIKKHYKLTSHLTAIKQALEDSQVVIKKEIEDGKNKVPRDD